jgi:hypothetical protein
LLPFRQKNKIPPATLPGRLGSKQISNKYALCSVAASEQA